MIRLFKFYFLISKSIFRTLSSSRINNYAKGLADYVLCSIFNKKYIRTVPWFLSVEPADFCQLACHECPVGMARKSKGQLIDMDLYKSLVEQIQSEVMHLQFFFQGEPLLHKALPEMIQLARSKRIFTSLSTNAQALTSDMACGLVQAGLDKITISLDGATQLTYEKYRAQAKLSRAVAGIHWLQYWKQKFASNFPVIEIQMVVFRTNEHELRAMKQLATSLQVDRLVFKSAQIYNLGQADSLVPKNKTYARYRRMSDGNWVLKKPLRNRCYRLWSGGVVRANGDVLPCCFDKKVEFKYGNVTDSDFRTIYTGAPAHAFRNSILQNRKQHEMCRNCNS